MQCRRTYTNTDIKCLQWLLLTASLTGYLLFPEIPFKINATPQDNALTITTVGKASSAMDMTENVTLVLEEHISQLPEIQSMESETTSALSQIRLRLHDPPSPETWNRLRQLLRASSFRLPDYVSVPLAGQEEAQSPALRILTWIPSDRRSAYTMLPRLIDSINAIPGTDDITTPLRRLEENDRKFDWQELPGAMLPLYRQALLTKDKTVHYKGHVMHSPLPHTLKALTVGNRTEVNGFEAAPLRITAGSAINELLWYFRIRNLLYKWKTELNNTFTSDPYREVWQLLLFTGGLFAALLMLQIMLQPRQLHRLLPLCCFPGLYVLFIFLLRVPAGPFALQLSGLYLVLVFLISAGIRIYHKTVWGILTAASALYFLSRLDFIPHGIKGEMALLSAGTAALSFVLITGYTKRGSQTPGSVSIITAFYGMLTGMIVLWGMSEWVISDKELVAKINNGTVTQPAFRTEEPGELYFHARRSSYAPPPTAFALDTVASRISTRHPAILIKKYGDETFELTARFPDAGRLDLLKIKSELRTLLFLQEGIQWTMEGAGESFQNNRIFIPGKYRIELDGPEYQKLQEITVHLADSLGELPGIGNVSVNQGFQSRGGHFRFIRKQIPGSGRDNHQLLQENLGQLPAIPDTMELLHRQYYPGNGRLEILGELQIDLVRSPDPVRRVAGHFRMAVEYEHFGGAKYARKFEKQLRSKIEQSLPFSYFLVPKQDHVYSGKVLRMIVLFIACIASGIAVISFEQGFHAIVILMVPSMTLVFLCLHSDIALTAESVISTMPLWIVFIVCAPMKRGTLCLVAGALILYEAGNLFFFQAEAETTHEYLAMNMIAGYVIVRMTGTSLRKSVPGWRQRFKKLLDLFRLGMVSKFVK